MKRSTNFKKFNLIERDELDRLRTKQIRDYSPVLSQLVTIKNEIDRVLGAPKLSPDDRVKILNLLHSRFDHIYKVLKCDGLATLPRPAAGILPNAAPLMPAAVVPAAGMPAAAVLAAAGVPAGPLPAGVGGIPAAFIPVPLVAQQQMQLAPLPAVDAGGAVDDPFGPVAEQEAHGLDEDLAAEPTGIKGAVGSEEPVVPGGNRGIETEPAVVWPTKQEMGITKNMEPKYNQFTAKLSKYPHLINRNAQNEILLNGVPIAGSNFTEGEQDFFNHLGSMGISPDEITNKESKALLPNAEFMEVLTSPKRVGTGRIKKGKSVHFKLPISSKEKLGPPPGKRPRILCVYH